MKPRFLSVCLILCLSACVSKGKKEAKDSTPKVTDSTVTAPDLIDHRDTTEKLSYIADQFNDYVKYGKIVVPPYGLEKIKDLLTAHVKTTEDPDEGDNYLEELDSTIYAGLSFDEQFTYNMIHPENYAQMCDGLPERKDEDHRIYGQLPNPFVEYSWSGRQSQFFTDHRDSVEALMKANIDSTGQIGSNFAEAIVDMNGTDMIPYLIDTYQKQQKKDHYLLTVLMLLMEKNKYPEFMTSTSCQKLYKKDTDTYSLYLVYNQANEDLIIQRATRFYNGLSSH